uniref:DUF4369 domain-containing protein n=1 Tax=Prevotella sp. GTC17262 TaxID=3236797 RepID=A0AB33JMA1_9BACT
MKILTLLPVLLLLLFSCGSKPRYRIEGTVTAGIADGQKIYLVPMTGANWGNVDSTYAHSGKFVFEGDTERVSIIRLPIRQRMQAQELLVVTEPGVIKVHLDTNSTTAGTPQNHLMQLWKDITIRRNKASNRYLSANMRHAPKDSIALLKQQADAADSAFYRFMKAAVKKHAGSTAGKFFQQYL